MDTSETYIKMCEKAVEIQATRANGYYEEGDRFYNVLDKKIEIAFNSWFSEEIGPFVGVMKRVVKVAITADFTGSYHIWLPRQDQLQEMIQPCGYLKFLRDFPDFAFSFDPYHSGIPWCASLLSMEQLWLAFVMKELYSKHWDGENWVKE